MQTDPEPTFEALFRELEDTVRRLEAGDLTLAQSLALFERGADLAEHCNTMLDQAELRVKQVVLTPDGRLSAEPLEILP
jgi:exodeoxyribonuclease VII small subunit